MGAVLGRRSRFVRKMAPVLADLCGNRQVTDPGQGGSCIRLLASDHVGRIAVCEKKKKRRMLLTNRTFYEGLEQQERDLTGRKSHSRFLPA